MPLLECLAERTIDKARLLQYLSARAGASWGALEVIGQTKALDETGQFVEAIDYRDPSTGAVSTILYPRCLDRDLDELVQAEYRRLAVAKPLTVMEPRLFDALFRESHCLHCRWHGPGYEQFHRECHFAGHPVNFEPVNTTP